MSAEESQYWDQDQYYDGDCEEIEVERDDEDLSQPLQDLSLVPFRRSNTGPGTISSSLTNSQLSRASTFNTSKATNTSKSGVRKPGSKTSKRSNSNKFPSRALTKPKDPLSFIDDLPFLPDPRHKVYLRQRLETLCSLVHLYPAQDSMRGSAYTTIIPHPSKSMEYKTKINNTDVPPNDTVEPLSRSDSRSFRRTNSTMSLPSSPSRSRRSNYSITYEDKLSLDHLAACIYSWASQSLVSKPRWIDLKVWVNNTVDVIKSQLMGLSTAIDTAIHHLQSQKRYEEMNRMKKSGEGSMRYIMDKQSLNKRIEEKEEEWKIISYASWRSIDETGTENQAIWEISLKEIGNPFASSTEVNKPLGQQRLVDQGELQYLPRPEERAMPWEDQSDFWER